MGRRLRIAHPNLLLAVVTSALCLGGLEVALRIARWASDTPLTVPSTEASPNRTLMWRYKPNSQRVYPRPAGQLGADAPVAHMNHWGFRGVDLPTRERRPGVVRVAFVGDSVTEGFGVEDDETFSYRYGVLAGAEVETLNFGVGGYNAPQVAELLRVEVLLWQPDFVVYALHLNDFDLDDASGYLVAYYGRPRSYLVDGLRRRLRPHQRPGEGYYDYHFRLQHEKVFAVLVDMQARLRDRGVPFLVAVLPVFDRAPGASEEPYVGREVHDSVTRFLDARGIPRVDLVERLREESGLPLTRLALPDDPWHPNPLGHDAIAAVLLDATRDLIDPDVPTSTPLE